MVFEVDLINAVCVCLKDEDDVRRVCQMQYLSWPDHGVPEDCSGFLDFVSHVRLNGAGVVEPTIVHCR